jgi:hypothetical protein
MAKSKSNNPEIEIKAKLGDSEKWKEWAKDCKDWDSRGSKSTHGTAGALYFVGFIGSLVYWWQAAQNFGAVITGLLKSLVWPAYIVYKLLESFYGVVH